MALEFIGKCAPIVEEIKRLADDGFRKAEVYMEEDFLTQNHVKILLDAKRRYGLKFHSIHTPHSSQKTFPAILEKTKQFAKKVRIPVIVVHSKHVDVFSPEVLDALEKGMFPENGLEHNLLFLEKIFKKGFKICLDTAHFYVASLQSGRDFYKDLGMLLKNHHASIGHMHLADISENFHDTTISEGEIDFFEVMPIISKYYKGVAVVEVPIDKQFDSLHMLERVMSKISK